MNAIMVSVDYDDILRLSLPYNRQHFNRVLVVTSLKNHDSVLEICRPIDVEVFATDSFYKNGALFNKWFAMEEGLQQLGRSGWMCVMDADILWPKRLAVWADDSKGKLYIENETREVSTYTTGQLITPLRRFTPNIPTTPPDESTWKQYPLTTYTVEWGGYSQIFHASDPVLHKCAMCGGAPSMHVMADHPHAWYQTNWRHAGGGDSFFQARWANKNKIRPPWECLHLGPHGLNWHGRTVPMADGSLPPNHDNHKKGMEEMYRHRRTNRGRGYETPIEKLL